MAGFNGKPMGLVCYICGREFFEKSLPIHLPQCRKLFIKQQKLRPRLERRPVPQPPRGMNKDGVLAGVVDVRDDQAREQFNAQQMDAFNEQTLVPCQHCGRTFFEERLQKHLRTCTHEKPMRRLQAGSGSSAGNKNPANNTQCHLSHSQSQNRRTNPAKHESVKPKKAAYDPRQAAAQSSHSSSSASSSSSSSPSPSGGKKAYLAKSTALRDAMKEARKITAMQKAGIPLSSLPPPKPSEPDPSFVECPHCQRTFNQQAAERHIPKCAVTINRPKPPPKLRRPGISAGLPRFQGLGRQSPSPSKRSPQPNQRQRPASSHGRFQSPQPNQRRPASSHGQFQSSSSPSSKFKSPTNSASQLGSWGPRNVTTTPARHKPAKKMTTRTSSSTSVRKPTTPKSRSAPLALASPQPQLDASVWHACMANIDDLEDTGSLSELEADLLCKLAFDKQSALGDIQLACGGSQARFAKNAKRLLRHLNHT